MVKQNQQFICWKSNTVGHKQSRLKYIEDKYWHKCWTNQWPWKWAAALAAATMRHWSLRFPGKGRKQVTEQRKNLDWRKMDFSLFRDLLGWISGEMGNGHERQRCPQELDGLQEQLSRRMRRVHLICYLAKWGTSNKNKRTFNSKWYLRKVTQEEHRSTFQACRDRIRKTTAEAEGSKIHKEQREGILWAYWTSFYKQGQHRSTVERRKA